MTDEAEYRVEFSITRRLPGEEDFTEVGFGSSGAWASVGQASHMASSAIENREWETTAAMPDPSTVDAGEVGPEANPGPSSEVAR